MTFEVRESCRIEVGGKLDEAFNRLNAKGTCYNAMKAKLEQVESRCEELLKELQLLDDQRKYLNCHNGGQQRFASSG